MTLHFKTSPSTWVCVSWDRRGYLGGVGGGIWGYLQPHSRGGGPCHTPSWWQGGWRRPGTRRLPDSQHLAAGLSSLRVGSRGLACHPSRLDPGVPRRDWGPSQEAFGGSAYLAGRARAGGMRQLRVQRRDPSGRGESLAARTRRKSRAVPTGHVCRVRGYW